MKESTNIRCGLCGKTHLSDVLCSDVIKSRDERKFLKVLSRFPFVEVGHNPQKKKEEQERMKGKEKAIYLRQKGMTTGG